MHTITILILTVFVTSVMLFVSSLIDVFHVNKREHEWRCAALSAAIGLLGMIFIVSSTVYRVKGLPFLDKNIIQTERIAYYAILLSSLFAAVVLLLLWAASFLKGKKNGDASLKLFGRSKANIILASVIQAAVVAIFAVSKISMISALAAGGLVDNGNGYLRDYRMFFVDSENNLASFSFDNGLVLTHSVAVDGDNALIEFQKTVDGELVAIVQVDESGNTMGSLRFLEAGVDQYSHFGSDIATWQSPFTNVARLGEDVGLNIWVSTYPQYGVVYHDGNTGSVKNYLRYYSILHYMPSPPSRNVWGTRFAISHCTAISNNTLIFCLGNQELYMYDTESESMTYLTSGRSPLVYRLLEVSD